MKKLKENHTTAIVFLKNNHTYVILFYIVFYLVGIIGMLIPTTHNFFEKLIPFALLISAAGLLIYHSKFATKTYIIYGTIFSTAFIVELIGVKTDLIFGSYYYGESLGIKLLDTPLIIGLNWLMLVYITSSMVRKITHQPLLQITTSALLMVGYDFILEHVAPQLDMWYWVKDTIPVKNFLAWFFLAFVFHFVFRLFNLKTTNQLALFMFACQTLFFLILWIALNITT